jgi:hypothetical protein
MQRQFKSKWIALSAALVLISVLGVFISYSGWENWTYMFYDPTPSSGSYYPVLTPKAQYNMAGNTYLAFGNPFAINGQVSSQFIVGNTLKFQKIVNKTRRWHIQTFSNPNYITCSQQTSNTTCVRPNCVYYPDPIANPNYYFDNYTAVASVNIPTGAIDFFGISRHRLADVRSRNVAYANPSAFYTRHDNPVPPYDATTLYNQFTYGKNTCPGYPALPLPPPPDDGDDE